jgi:hypothetical protein
MKLTIKTAVVLLLSTTFCWADTVYLKSGDIIRNCKVLAEKDQSVLVDKGDKWVKYKATDIEMIDYQKDKIAPEKPEARSLPVSEEIPEHGNISDNGSMQGVAPSPTVSTNGSVAIKDKLVLKVGLDLGGKLASNNATVTVNGFGTQGVADSNVSVVNSYEFSGEYTCFGDSDFGLGGGASFLLPRKATDYSGNFQFIPFYGIVSLRSKIDRDTYRYITGQLGYSILSGDNNFAGSGTLTGGLHYAVGAGMVFNDVVLELLYAVENGHYNYSDAISSLDANIVYSRYTLNVGFRFSSPDDTEGDIARVRRHGRRHISDNIENTN